VIKSHQEKTGWYGVLSDEGKARGRSSERISMNEGGGLRSPLKAPRVPEDDRKEGTKTGGTVKARRGKILIFVRNIPETIKKESEFPKKDQ